MCIRSHSITTCLIRAPIQSDLMTTHTSSIHPWWQGRVCPVHYAVVTYGHTCQLTHPHMSQASGKTKKVNLGYSWNGLHIGDLAAWAITDKPLNCSLHSQEITAFIGVLSQKCCPVRNLKARAFDPQAHYLQIVSFLL